MAVGITFGTWGEGWRPRWCGDYLHRDTLIPGGAFVVASEFPVINTVVVTVAAGGAAQGAVAVPVAALSGAIPNGTLMSFSSGEFAKLTAAAVAGATSLTVEALPNALEENDTYTYVGGNVRRYIPSGTLVGRTFAERESGTGFGPWAASDDEVFLVVHDIYDAADNAEVTLLRNGKVVKENFLPNWTDTALWTSGAKAALRAKYNTTKGAD